MGAWNTKPFGNDTASDWLYKLEKATNESVVLQALDEITTGSGLDDASACEEAVAAAVLVAAARSNPIGTVPPLGKAWVKQRGYVPSDAIVRRAAAAVEAIMQKSDLQELWEESRSYPAWQREMQQLLARLRELETIPAPTRQPQSPPRPRLLCKMIEMLSPESEGPVRDKVRQQLAALEDVNAYLPRSLKSPLAAVAAQGLIPEAELLLARGAKVNLDPGNYGNSPLEYAAANNQAGMIEFLLTHGAELHEDLVLDASTGVPAHQDYTGATMTVRVCHALWSAVRGGAILAVNALLNHGADLNQKDLNGETLIHKAVYHNQIEMIEFLVQSGLDINARKQGDETPLHWAVQGRRTECVRRLLELGADPNPISGYAEGTALDMIEDRESEIARLLIQYGGRFSADAV